MKLWHLSFLILFTISCTNKQQSSNFKGTVVFEEKTKTDPIEIHKIDSVREPIADTTKKILSYNTEHFFVDTVQKSNFGITLYGKNIIDGVVVFKITDINHKQLFKEVFWSVDLLGDMADLLSIKQQKDTIRNRMAHFFDETNFVNPAIEKKEIFDDALDGANISEKPAWEAIKADSNSIGFVYSYGYEGTNVIAFSQRKKKVMVVFYSD